MQMPRRPAVARMPAARSTSSLPSTHLPNRRPSRCETKRWMSGSMHRSERRTRLLLRQVLPETDRVRASPSNPPLPSSRSPTYASHPSCETRACPHAVEAASASLIRLTCFTLGTVPADTRPKRKAVTAPGALAEPAVVNSSRSARARSRSSRRRERERGGGGGAVILFRYSCNIITFYYVIAIFCASAGRLGAFSQPKNLSLQAR